MIMLLIG